MKNDAKGSELAAIIEGAAAPHPLKKWMGISLCLVLLGGGVWYYFHNQTQEVKPTFITEELYRGDLDLVITATGNLAPTNQVTVGSELSGIISNVYVDTNDLVKKGQPIAMIDTTKVAQQTERNRAILLANKARVSLAEATVSQTTSALGHLKDLYQISGGKSPSSLDMENSVATAQRAQADLESAKASVAQAEADLKAIERDLYVTVIRSPVDGIVLTRSIEIGQTVAASFTAPILFVIAEDLRKMDLVVTVAEADIGRLQDHQTATFTVDAWPTRTYTASVKRVSFGSVITTNVVTYQAELSVENNDLSLRPGMTATADITVAKATNVFLVPNAALRFDPATVEQLNKPKEEPKRTLVQQLSTRSRYRSGPPALKVLPRSKEPRIWTLVNHKPVEAFVKVGLTDGRLTEVSAEGLTEGSPIIVSAIPPEAP